MGLEGGDLQVTKDPFASFDDLKDFPGKRKPLNRVDTSAVEDRVLDPWDEKPVIYVYKGQSREFFTIGHLSKALNRSPVTIRSWEKKGLLPSSPYRSPSPRVSHINGPPKGKRLYVRDQIEGILQIAKEENCIIDAAQSAPTERFAQRVAQLYKLIREQDK